MPEVDPAVAAARASLGNATMRKHAGDIAAARARLRIARAEQKVREIVEAAPPLNQEQRDRLADLLRNA